MSTARFKKQQKEIEKAPELAKSTIPICLGFTCMRLEIKAMQWGLNWRQGMEEISKNTATNNA